MQSRESGLSEQWGKTMETSWNVHSAPDGLFLKYCVCLTADASTWSPSMVIICHHLHIFSVSIWMSSDLLLKHSEGRILIVWGRIHVFLLEKVCKSACDWVCGSCNWNKGHRKRVIVSGWVMCGISPVYSQSFICCHSESWPTSELHMQNKPYH